MVKCLRKQSAKKDCSEAEINRLDQLIRESVQSLTVDVNDGYAIHRGNGIVMRQHSSQVSQKRSKNVHDDFAKAFRAVLRASA
ncbi:hypothetical protein ACWU37_21060 (plasmid) [Photobacterium damselae subsp. damselae]